MFTISITYIKDWDSLRVVDTNSCKKPNNNAISEFYFYSFAGIVYFYVNTTLGYKNFVVCLQRCW